MSSPNRVVLSAIATVALIGAPFAATEASASGCLAVPNAH